MNACIKSKILIVDDIPENIDFLREALKADHHIMATTSAHKTAEIARIRQPDLILLDIMMPEIDGYQVCEQLKQDPCTAEIPVIFISAKGDPVAEGKGLKLGAVDYIHKPAHPIIVRRRINLHLDSAERKKRLQHEIFEHKHTIKKTRLSIIQRLCQAAEFKDNETALHVVRMSHYAKEIALAANVDTETASLLLHASPMHDIGKIGIPDSILLKPGKLTNSEFEVMKQHPKIGAQIIGDDSSPLLSMARDIALYHHEKWDGSGYPHKLKGDDIPVSARIVAIADVFDALTSERPYKKAWSIEKAVELINTESGKHFDPELVQYFLKALPKILTLKERYQD